MIAECGEDRDRVAAGVDCEEQALVAVKLQRALRRQVVDYRTGQAAAKTAGRVGIATGKRAVMLLR